MPCTICIGCGKCGMNRTLPNEVICPMCGTLIEIATLKCDSCGFEFTPPGIKSSIPE